MSGMAQDRPDDKPPDRQPVRWDLLRIAFERMPLNIAVQPTHVVRPQPLPIGVR